MKYFKYLFSGAFMAILLLIFAIAVAYATFIENDYDAIAARLFVYNAWWFELILFLMVVNFTGMIWTKYLYVKSKLNILLIHVALVIIIAGAGVTRYFGYEGQMHIRNGQISNQFSSSDLYLYSVLENGGESIIHSEKLMLTTAKQNLYSSSIKVGEEPVNIEILRFLPNTVQKVVPVENGEPYLTIIVGTPEGRKEFHLRKGQSAELSSFAITYGESSRPEDVSIIDDQGLLMIKAPDSIATSHSYNPQMPNKPGEYGLLELLTVQKIGDTSFIVTNFEENGDLQYQAAPEDVQTGVDMVHVKVNDQYLYLRKGYTQNIDLGNVKGSIYMGYMVYQLPFSIELRRFELERYPGSQSPSSYASEVTVIDGERGERFPFRIYMNNILNYRGYRFFQSSFDQDELGTVLSVNRDFWGTLITYIGYGLLFLGLILSFFTSKTRIRTTLRQIKEVHRERQKTLVTVSALLLSLFVLPSATAQQKEYTIDKEHAAEFGRLLVQSNQGRIEPFNTVANKYLVKIHKKASYQGQSAEQVIFGFIVYPEYWETVPLIKVGDEELRNILEIEGDYASFVDFIDDDHYKLRDLVNKAYMKKPAARSTFDKEIINVDERFNVTNAALGLEYLKIFPIEGHDQTWLKPIDFHNLKGHGSSEGDLFEAYTLAVQEAVASGSYETCESALEAIKDYQREYGEDIMPASSRIDLEIYYNELNVFKRLFPVYFVLGILLIGIFFLQTFNPKLNFKVLSRVLTGLLILAFLVQTAGLVMRWVISEHAPWSNGYESMIYIAWATMLAGFVFMKNSPAALAVTALLAGITLLTAHMSWLNPEITNLVPVLKSYWLTIHVATITASYGFLGLGCLMGFLILCMMIFRNDTNRQRIDLTLRELTFIVELSLSVGLILLVIGNFLGGIWANESWGRYWGWDPKESWTLVSIVVYSFTLHLRLIPKIRNAFTFNFFAVIGFGCVLMTYFGVNYYLSGLHSYAGGDPVPVPSGVYFAFAIIALVGILAGFNEYRATSKQRDPDELDDSDAELA